MLISTPTQRKLSRHDANTADVIKSSHDLVPPRAHNRDVIISSHDRVPPRAPLPLHQPLREPQQYLSPLQPNSAFFTDDILLSPSRRTALTLSDNGSLLLATVQRLVPPRVPSPGLPIVVNDIDAQQHSSSPSDSNHQQVHEAVRERTLLSTPPLWTSPPCDPKHLHLPCQLRLTHSGICEVSEAWHDVIWTLSPFGIGEPPFSLVVRDADGGGGQSAALELRDRNQRVSWSSQPGSAQPMVYKT